MDKSRLIHDLADRACDGIDMKDLVAFYYDSQVEYFEELSGEELIQQAIENGHIDSIKEAEDEYGSQPSS